MKQIIIIGGGISGLAAAHRLAELARTQKQNWQITLLEASRRLGGVIETTQQKDFLLEGGPDCFISEKPWARELCERIGLGRELIETGKILRRSFLVQKGRLREVPQGFYLTIPSNLEVLARTPIFSWTGKLRMAADLLIPPSKNKTDESVASFIRRRLGREALERLGQPMIGGIYAGDPERLSIQATLPHLVHMEREFGSLIRGVALGKNHQNASGPRYSLFLSLKNGIESLIQKLKEKMPEVKTEYSCSVTGLEKGEPWKIKTQDSRILQANAVCLAIPAPHAAKLVISFAPALAEDLQSIRYESAATVNLAFPEVDIPSSLRGFGFVVPETEGKKIIGCTFSSIKFPGRAPAGFVLLRAFVGGSFHPELLNLDDEALISLVRRELQDILKIDRTPLWAAVSHFPSAMPQYETGHLEKVRRIKEEARQHSGLYLTGNAYEGVGIPDCIHHAEQTAEQIANYLVSHEESSYR